MPLGWSTKRRAGFRGRRQSSGVAVVVNCLVYILTRRARIPPARHRPPPRSGGRSTPHRDRRAGRRSVVPVRRADVRAPSRAAAHGASRGRAQRRAAGGRTLRARAAAAAPRDCSMRGCDHQRDELAADLAAGVARRIRPRWRAPERVSALAELTQRLLTRSLHRRRASATSILPGLSVLQPARAMRRRGRDDVSLPGGFMIPFRPRARPPAFLSPFARRGVAHRRIPRGRRARRRRRTAPPTPTTTRRRAVARDTIVEQITVTATREEELLVETPASVGIVKAETIALDKPTHPAQVMGQMPGVAVAVTNGEGHIDRDPPAVHHQPGLSLPRGRHPDPLDRLLQPQRALRDQPAAGGRDRGASTVRRPRSTARTRSAAWSTC